MLKRRPVGHWEHCCQHMISREEVPEPRHPGLWFIAGWNQPRSRRRPEALAYRIDQELGRLRVPYSMTLEVKYPRVGFLVVVSEEHAGQVATVITRLKR